jgi:hypothetical protein
VVTDYIDALLRPPQISIPELVTALRDLHERKSIRASPQPTDPTTTSNDPIGHLPLFDRNLLLSRLVSSADDLIQQLRPPLGKSEPARSSQANRYASLQGRFGELETELRRHAENVDRLLDRSDPASAEPSGVTFHQQTLYLQCPSGGRSAGRFRCINRRVERMSVTSLVRPFTRNLEPLAAAPTLSLRPDSFVLSAGASEVITVEVDFGSCPELASGVLQTSIEVRKNDAMFVKIWIEVELYEQC